jgi:hypothetical protein
MEIGSLNKYIEDPSILDEHSLLELRTLIRKNPYFHLLYPLFLLNLKNIDDPRFEEFLKKYAIFIKDRTEFFRQLNYLESRKKLLSETESTSVTDRKENTTHAPESSEEQEYNGDISSEKNRKDEKTIQRASSTNQAKKTTEDRNKKQYTREYLGNRISNTLTKQIDEAGEKDEEEKKSFPDFFILDKSSKIRERDQQDREPEEQHKSDSGNNKNEEESFELEEKQERKENKKSNKAPYKNKNPFSSQYFDEDYLSMVSKNPEKEEDDLIARFIKEDPELDVKEPRNEEQEDISENSVQENEDFLSEKLANVYVKQGYYNKAIEAFKKLSLKYPKKSDYFAEQIKKVKQIINEQ